jgi:thiol-disulfide isomerase/thioredoxin
MKPRFTAITTVIALALGGFAFQAYGEQPQKPKVIGVLMYSDTCGSCKVLDPKIQNVKQEFAGEPILFTRVDQSNDFTQHQSKLHTAQLGIHDVYEEQEGKTGYMLLIKTEDNSVAGRLTRDQSEEEIKAAIEQALKA